MTQDDERDRSDGDEEGTKQLPARTPHMFRADPTLERRLKNRRGKLSDQDLFGEAVRLWLNQKEGLAPRKHPVELKDALVVALTRHLRDNDAWAEAAIVGSNLDVTVSLYLQRLLHFHEEKLELANQFLKWLMRRLVHFGKQKRRVILIIESGSTLKTVFDVLGPELQKNSELRSLKPGTIEIITNNFPGAESYEALAGRRSDGGTSLGDLVPCHLVPGVALREYSAIVGAKAEEYLSASCATAEDDRGTLRVGLVAANWVLLEGHEARPTLLARGAQHKSFKEAVLRNCDEAYLVSPLCKIVQTQSNSPEEGLRRFNEDFRGDDAETQEKGEYKRVELLGEMNPTKLKLVTTCRNVGGSIVHAHSVSIRRSLTWVEEGKLEAMAEKPIEEIVHFLYPFDVHSKLKPQKQVKKEMPHKRTQSKQFRHKYFSSSW
jgi:hypothetical protein